MALATNTQFHMQASATTGNVNGGGFNPANANMMTDLTVDGLSSVSKLPDGDVSRGSWTTDTGGTTNLYTKINDTSDASYITTTSPNTSCVFTLADMPSDLVNVGAVSATIRLVRGSSKGDYLQMGAVQIFKSDGVTPLTSAVVPADSTSITDVVITLPLAGIYDKTSWDGAVIKLTSGIGTSGSSISVYEVAVSLTYNTVSSTTVVVSSASYSFDANDVDHWLFTKATGYWPERWLKILSVSGGKATVDVSAGAGQTRYFGYKSETLTAGIAETEAAVGGTFTIDYSQSDTALLTATDFAAVGSSTTLTSATGGFKKTLVGNFFHQTTTGTGGFGLANWFEIVSYTNATTLVLDRTPNSGTASVACTGYIGGAARFNALEDAFCEALPAGAKVYIKAGTYVFSGAVSIASTNGTTTDPIVLIGYNTFVGDNPSESADQPLFALGATVITGNVHTYFKYIYATGTGNSVISLGSAGTVTYCTLRNTSTTANRAAVIPSTGTVNYCDLVSQNGRAIAPAGSNVITRIHNCYIHDSLEGIFANTANSTLTGNIFANNLTSDITNSGTSGNLFLVNNTFYGRKASPQGVGYYGTGASNPTNRFYNNNFLYHTTGLIMATAIGSNFGEYNNFYGNTTDVTNYTKSPTDTAVDPDFADVGEVSFSNGTITGGTASLTVSGADLSNVVANKCYVRITANTGGTGTFIGNYLITAVDNTTKVLTLNNNAGTSGSATNVTGYIMTGLNFKPAASAANVNYKMAGGLNTTQSPAAGAVQPAGGSSSNTGSIFSTPIIRAA